MTTRHLLGIICIEMKENPKDNNIILLEGKLSH